MTKRCFKVIGTDKMEFFSLYDSVLFALVDASENGARDI